MCVWDNVNVVTVLLEEAEAEEGGGAGRMQNNTTRTPYNNVGNCGKCMPVIPCAEFACALNGPCRQRACRCHSLTLSKSLYNLIINPCLQHGIVKRVMQLVCLNTSALVVLDFETRKRLHHSKT